MSLFSTPRIIGYWNDKDDPKYNAYPTPISNTNPLPTIQKFSTNLRLIQNNETNTRVMSKAYRCLSTCVLCGKTNGCVEYTTDRFIWPSQYLHYIEDHNVDPDPEFYFFVMDQMLFVDNSIQNCLFFVFITSFFTFFCVENLYY